MFASLQLTVMLLLTLALFLVEVFALVDAARRPAGAFTSAGKRTKVFWVSILAGGALLLQRRLISWHAPVGMLGSLFVISLLCWNGSGSDSNGSPLFHWLTGATMLGAFFIVTEPVSGPDNPRARLLFGVGVGLIVYVIRTWGAYPDGVAFAVLLMNLAVPALERLTALPATPGAQS